MRYEKPEPLLAQIKKRGETEEPQDHVPGRNRGGLTTKIHMPCDANSIPLKFLLSGGQASDIAYAQSLLAEAYIPSLCDRPRKRCRWLLVVGCWLKGYDSEALRRHRDRYRMQPVISSQYEAKTQAKITKTA